MGGENGGRGHWLNNKSTIRFKKAATFYHFLPQDKKGSRSE
jgi:hypothetical protein